MARTHAAPAPRPSRAVEHGEFAREVIAGLSRPRKTLPCRFFYDARGSELFEAITRLPEYYPTRVETGILAANAHDMVSGIADGSVLVEYGSGSSRKTELLLAALPASTAYAAIDVSESALHAARRRLLMRFPKLDVRVIVADFAEPVVLPHDLAGRPRLGFFPGSTIGNFAPADAVRQLAIFRQGLGAGSRFLAGVDLRKDARTLLAAYDDASGVTAEFNLNLLRRVNRELGGDFDRAGFRHRAIWNEGEGRIEMHLVSTRAQEVRVLGRVFRFAAGESIHTENSYKYTLEGFRDLARAAGWRPERCWTDSAELFSVHELVAA